MFVMHIQWFAHRELALNNETRSSQCQPHQATGEWCSAWCWYLP